MTADLAALQRVLSRTALRLRVQCGLTTAAWTLAVCALIASACQIWAPLSLRALVALLLGLPVGVALLRSVWPISRAQLAARLDHEGALDGRMSAAVALLCLSSRSAFEDAALRDANRHASPELPGRVAPLRVPRVSLPMLLALLLLVGLRLVPAPTVRPTALVTVPPPSRLLDADELSGLRVPVTDEPLSPALTEARKEYDELLAALAAGALPGEQAVARALRLENELRHVDEPELSALQSLALALKRTRPALSRALAEDLSRAAEELRKLSLDVREQKLDQAARRQLAAALDEARKRESERLAARQAEEEKSLLRRKKDTRTGTSAGSSTDRQLETLRRESPATRELSRELGNASDALSQQQPEAAADSLNRGASTLDQLKQEQQNAARQRELSEAVSQLRELLQRRALEQQRAQAQRDESADTQQQQQQRQRFRERASGEPADAGSARGESLEASASGSAQTRQTATVQLPGQAPAMVQPIRTSGAGSEHDPGKLETPTRARSDYQDQRLLGASGAGPTRSQLIRSAAASGFAQQGYRKVYGDYRAFAETVLERDQVPPGQRFFVRRYFELVRPREGQAPP